MKEKVVMNSRGEITIPIQLREAFGLKANDELILESRAEGILLRPSLSMPIEPYSEARVAEFAAEDAAIGKVLGSGR